MCDASRTKSQTALQSNQPMRAPEMRAPEMQAPDTSFAALAELYQIEERKLEDIAGQFQEDPAIAPEIRHLDFQTEIMELAGNARARTFKDLYFKMMLWYWDTPELSDTSNMTRADCLLLSVLEDLNQLSEFQIEKSA